MLRSVLEVKILRNNTLLKFVIFTGNSIAGGVWDLKMVYCKKQPLKQIVWKKELTNLCRILDDLLKNSFKGTTLGKSYW